jgi:fermentation-respiration switch protein FrsA (DUF1100 family)
MRKDVAFVSKGLHCSGWLYVPDDLTPGQKAPAIVMGHGFTAVKDQALPDFAERFTAAGFATLVFDYRYFGESDGEPRGQLFPLEQVEDFRNAITWVSQQSEVDPQRVGIWGTSFGGGVVTFVATFDRRVKAVVAQVPSLLNAEYRRKMDPGRWEAVGQLLQRDRVNRYETGTVNYMNVVAPGAEPCVLPGQDAYEAFMTGPTSSWRNQITIESLEKIREFDPVSLIHLVTPAALLVMPAEHDTLIPIEAVRAAFDRANEPKALSVLPIKHFDVYREPWLRKAADTAIDWFRKYL